MRVHLIDDKLKAKEICSGVPSRSSSTSSTLSLSPGVPGREKIVRRIEASKVALIATILDFDEE